MEEIIVIGGGGHAKVVISVLRKMGTFHILGYTDLRNNGALLQVPYLGDDAVLKTMAADGRKLNVALGIGQVGLGKARSELLERLSSLEVKFPVIVSPSSIVNEGVALGDGTVVMNGAVINSGAAVGKAVIVNTSSVIEHDVILGDWVHVAPGVTVSGGTKIGDRSMVGAGAVIIEGRSIAADCMIGAGAVVIHDLTESGIYVGCPARRIR